MRDFPAPAMSRRFGGLNPRNLLYLQAELVKIERKLLEIENVNARNEDIGQ
jgi:hypothetical protein